MKINTIAPSVIFEVGSGAAAICANAPDRDCKNVPTLTSNHDTHRANCESVMLLPHHESLQDNSAQQSEAPKGNEHWDIQASSACTGLTSQITRQWFEVCAPWYAQAFVAAAGITHVQSTGYPLTYETTDDIQHIDQSQGQDAASDAPLKLWSCHNVAGWSNYSHLEKGNCDGKGKSIQREQRLRNATIGIIGVSALSILGKSIDSPFSMTLLSHLTGPVRVPRA
jgi:hypothetical protein